MRALIVPSHPTAERKREDNNHELTSAANHRHREGRLFIAPYPYPVTKTETKTKVVVTGTTTVTFKCTPGTSIMPACK